MARCPYCGEFTKGDACEDHDDLPALDYWWWTRPSARLDMNDPQIVDKLLATAKGTK